MIVKVDWISFSLTWTRLPGHGAGDVFASLSLALDKVSSDLADILDMKVAWEEALPRAPYSRALRHWQSGVTLFYHPDLDHCLFEISGKGCEWLWNNGTLFALLNAVQNRVTRVDLACDMEVDTRPVEFVAQRVATRFRAHSTVVSESGETCYIGAKTSNRYARVYRYNPPHERAHLLRCEYVLKAEDAKLTVPVMLSDGLEAVASSLGDKFGWQHAAWNSSKSEPVNLATWRPERREGKTLFWLADTIAPLMARLHKEGVIDVQQWIDENVKPLLL